MGTVWVMFDLLNLFPMSKGAVYEAKRRMWRSSKGQSRSTAEEKLERVQERMSKPIIGRSGSVAAMEVEAQCRK